ncbi:hypothetical protein BVX94_00125 [bacterium B17]|nr:hypothetical protein BVX94_00125 [bacterium B17]
MICRDTRKSKETSSETASEKPSPPEPATQAPLAEFEPPKPEVKTPSWPRRPPRTSPSSFPKTPSTLSSKDGVLVTQRNYKELLSSPHMDSVSISPNNEITLKDAPKTSLYLIGTIGKNFTISGEVKFEGNITRNHGGRPEFMFREKDPTHRYEIYGSGLRNKRRMMNGSPTGGLSFPWRTRELKTGEWYEFKFVVHESGAEMTIGSESGKMNGPLAMDGKNYITLGMNAALRNLRIKIDGDTSKTGSSSRSSSAPANWRTNTSSAHKLTKETYRSVLARYRGKSGSVEYSYSPALNHVIRDFPADRRKYSDRPDRYAIPNMDFEPSKGESLCAPLRSNSKLNVKINGVVVTHLYWEVNAPLEAVNIVRETMQKNGWLLLEQMPYETRWRWGGLKMVKICVNEELDFPVGGYNVRTPTLVFSSPSDNLRITIAEATSKKGYGKSHYQSTEDILLGKWDVSLGGVRVVWEFNENGSVNQTRSTQGSSQGTWVIEEKRVFIRWSRKHWNSFHLPLDPKHATGANWSNKKVTASKIID